MKPETKKIHKDIVPLSNKHIKILPNSVLSGLFNVNKMTSNKPNPG